MGTWPPAWWQEAACLGAGTDIFFPVGEPGVPTEAAAYCARCPVTAECAAASRGASEGVWAGVRIRRRYIGAFIKVNGELSPAGIRKRRSRANRELAAS
jgi:Transcription factor WhiB